MLPADIIEFQTIRNVPETVNVTFEFVRQNFRVLWKSLLMFAFPPLALGSVLFSYYFFGIIAELSADLSSSSYGVFEAMWQVLLSGLYGGVLCGIGLTILVGVVHSTVAQYREHGPGEFSVGDVWQGVRKDFWMLLGTMFGLGLVVSIIWVMSLIVPFGSLGVYILMVLGYLYFPIRIFERRGFLQSFVVSSSLISGRFWATFGMGALLTLMSMAFAFIVMIPFVLVGWIGDFMTVDLMKDMDGDATRLFLTVILGTYYSVSLLLYAIPILSAVFHYYSLKERKDAPTIVAQIPTIGPEVLPDPPRESGETSSDRPFEDDSASYRWGTPPGNG